MYQVVQEKTIIKGPPVPILKRMELQIPRDSNVLSIHLLFKLLLRKGLFFSTTSIPLTSSCPDSKRAPARLVIGRVIVAVADVTERLKVGRLTRV